MSYPPAAMPPPQTAQPPQPGMPPQAPPAPPPPLPYQNTAPPMTEDDVKDWRLRLTAARDPIQAIITEGKINISRYRVKHLLKQPLEHEVVVPLDFSYTEQKKAQIFFQVPEIHLEATRPELEPTAPIAQAVINRALGVKPAGVDLKTAMFEILTDVICPVGYGVIKFGYETYVDGTKPVQVGTEPVPGGQPGAVLGLGAQPMQPVMQQVPNVVSECYYARRVPPGHFRAPFDFMGSDFDDSPWVGWRFCEDVPASDPTAKRYRGNGNAQNDDEMLLIDPVQTSRTKPKKRWGTEVFYRACRFDPTCKNPELVRTFKLYDDEDEPSVHEDSRDQRWAPDGSLIGMPGYNLHVLTLRYTSDSCYPQSDMQTVRQTIDEISKGRTDLMRRRNRSLPQVAYDSSAVTPDSLAAIQKNENTAFIGFARPVDDSTFREIPKGTFGRENFAFNDQAQRDLDTAMALGASAGVLRSDSPETATKSSQIQSAVDTRLEAERTRVLEYLVKGAMKLFGLIQVYADQQDYVRLDGQSAAARLQAWDKTTIGGLYAFKAKPNSHVRLDADGELKKALDYYNIGRNDANANGAELFKNLTLAYGYDPQRSMKQPDPKGPDPAKGSIAFKIEDFIGPGAPIAIELAAQAGYKISPQAMQATQGFAQIWAQIQQEQAQAQAMQKAADEHGGAAERTEPIDKHALDKTGQLPGPGPM